MIKFEKVELYKDSDLPLPTRSTAASAGYDFVVAEDTIILPTEWHLDRIFFKLGGEEADPDPITLDELGKITKELGAKPTLVPTGMKCQLEPDTYLELSVRSSTPLKYWLLLANGVGIIDADYYNNPDNEGHIFFQLINLTSRPILLRKGEKIGQGIIKHYLKTYDDQSIGERIGGFGSTNV